MIFEAFKPLSQVRSATSQKLSLVDIVSIYLLLKIHGNEKVKNRRKRTKSRLVISVIVFTSMSPANFGPFTQKMQLISKVGATLFSFYIKIMTGFKVSTCREIHVIRALNCS